MKYKNVFIIISALLLSVIINIHAQNPARYEFVRAKGRKLVAGKQNKEVRLRGVCFGNRVWEKIAVPDTHHTIRDYKRLQKMGITAVRFYMYYGTFENTSKPYTYKKSGWDWLDRNVAWAKKHKIYLILNMHVPQGGFQSLAQGNALWENRENQKRLTALWKAIAERYSNETAIAAYDLVNEPVTTKSVDQWKNLAQEIIDQIRTVDKNHLIIVEKLLGVRNRWDTYSNNDYTQFLVRDKNIMYQFHFYHPIEYTHQKASWTSFGEGGSYPDENIFQVPEDTVWKETSGYKETIPAGDSNWKLYTGKLHQVKDKKIIAGFPVFVSRNNRGTAYFDMFVIKEYNSKKKFVRDIMTVNLRETTGWNKWSADNKGRFSYTNSSGHKDSFSLTISSTSDDANYTGRHFPFRPRKGRYYQINGWMKGENINNNAECCMRLDFYTSRSNTPIYKRNKKYLEVQMKLLTEFGRKHNVPMFCGEFGLYKECFKNKGGLVWVKDMLRLLDKYKVNYTYHAYHEDAFGIFYNANTYPDYNNSNRKLVELYGKYLRSLRK